MPYDHLERHEDSHFVAEPRSAESEHYSRQRVLFVDDDPRFLDEVRQELHDKFDLTTAVGALAGLHILRKEPPFAVVVSDFNMEMIRGVELLKEAQRIHRDTVTMIVTADTHLDTVIAAFHEGHIFRFLLKSSSMDIVARSVRQCLEQYRLLGTARVLNEELSRANDALRSLNLWLEEIVTERTAIIRRLHRFVTELNGLDSLEAVANVVVKTAVEMLECQRISLMLPDSNNEYLSIIAASGLPDNFVKSFRMPIGGLIPGRAYADQTTIVINNARELPPTEDRLDEGLFTDLPLVSVPLQTAEGPVGVLNVSGRNSDQLVTLECLANLRAIAEAAAIAIHNQIRLRERNEARDATILALAKLAENRDPETGAHLERVQHFCSILAEAMSAKSEFASTVTTEFIKNIVRSSPLHDIGKVGIPDHILLKPGRLTPEEFEVMKMHSVIGGDTIRALVENGRRRGFLRMAMEIAYCHHEKFNGQGYPNGLAGTQIPLAARIMAVADVYDALTSRRIYKSPMSHAQAVEIIQRDSGTHFDPEVVAVLLENQEQFESTAKQLADNNREFVDVFQANAEEQSLSLDLQSLVDAQ